jgi:hypothetical protein
MSGVLIPLSERQPRPSQRNVSSPFSLAIPPRSQRRSTYQRADTPTQYLDPPKEVKEKKGTPYLEIPTSTTTVCAQWHIAICRLAPWEFIRSREMGEAEEKDRRSSARICGYFDLGDSSCGWYIAWCDSAAEVYQAASDQCVGTFLYESGRGFMEAIRRCVSFLLECKLLHGN